MSEVDNIRLAVGGEDESLWQPADWAAYLARVIVRPEGVDSLLAKLRAMPHWSTVELWNEYRLQNTVGKRPEGARAGEADFDAQVYLAHLQESLRALLASNFKSWSGLHNFLGYTLDLPGEIDTRVDMAGAVNVSGAIVSVTGRLGLPSDYYRGLVIEAGGKWTESAVASASYLIAGKWASDEKLDMAARHGVPIRGEAALRASLCSILGMSEAELDKAAPALAEAHPAAKAVAFRPRAPKPKVAWLNICITGRLDKPRKAYHAAIVEAGGAPLDDVTKDCQLLVVGEAAGSKLRKAEKAGVPVCSLADFVSMLAERGVNV